MIVKHDGYPPDGRYALKLSPNARFHIAHVTGPFMQYASSRLNIPIKSLNEDDEWLPLTRHDNLPETIAEWNILQDKVYNKRVRVQQNALRSILVFKKPDHRRTLIVVACIFTIITLYFTFMH